MFDEKAFEKQLETSWLGQDFIYLEEVDSTNSYLRRIEAKQVEHGTLCLTDNQTKGRGRYERKWIAEPAENLTFTLTFKPARTETLHVLTLACALSIASTIDQWLEIDTRIKWPNDIYIEDRKVGGILTESVFTGNQLDRVLVGIGINVNQQSFPIEIENRATSLSKIFHNGLLSRESLLAGILQNIEYNYTRWSRFETALLKNINRKIIGYGQWVHLHVDGEPWKGRCKFLGINQNGYLVVLTSQDEVKRFTYEQVRIATD